MPSAERSVTINRPAADVFAFVADGTNAPQWRSGVVEIKRVSGEGAGAVYRQRLHGPFRRRVSADYEITVYEPNKKLEFRGISGPLRPTGGYGLTESNGKTKITFWLDAQIGRLRGLILGRSLRKSMDAEMKSLDRLKELLERDASANTGTSATSAPSAKASAGSGAPKPSAGTKPKPAVAKSAAAKPATPRTARRRSKAS